MIVAGMILAAVLGAAAVIAVGQLSGDENAVPAPVLTTTEDHGPAPVQQLSFPALATRNTTRVAGVDPTDDAAAVALATHPSAGDVERAAAVTLVTAGDWAAGIAAAPLVADPIGAPVLVGEPDSLPDQTESAIAALRPTGSPETDHAQAFAVGDVSAPDEIETTRISGGDPAEIAAEVDRLRGRLTREKPRGIVLVSTEDPAFAMPAAAWAARSGDPVLFVERNRVPKPTMKALKRHKDTPVFLLGPEEVASDKVQTKVEKRVPDVQRISADDPVSSAIAFARFDSSGFGWGVNDPGHGLVIENSAQPLDAAASAALSAGGDWGPLLVTDDADSVPAALRGYLLDIKPGYRTDPTRALYNHAWLIGDTSLISIPFQAEVDESLELVRIQPPAGT